MYNFPPKFQPQIMPPFPRGWDDVIIGHTQRPITSDSFWQCVGQAVAKWQTADNSCGARFNWQSFGRLLQAVRERHPRPYPLAEQGWAIAIALWLTHSNKKPTELAHLYEVLHQTIDELGILTHNECLEVVVAWGCGWRFPPEQSDDVVEQALFAFARLVESSIRWTLKHVFELLEGYSQQSFEQGREYANYITLELIYGVQSEKEALKLSCWNPQKDETGQAVRLRAFVAQAVRGLATDQLKGGAFKQGLLYPILREDVGLHIDSTEFKVCHVCQSRLVERARTGQPLRISDIAKQDGQRPGFYLGSRCPTCDTPANAQTFYLLRRNWFLIPFDHAGNYLMEKRWRCKGCQNLYHPKQQTCPLCVQTNPQRHTAVWVYHADLRRERIIDAEE